MTKYDEKLNVLTFYSSLNVRKNSPITINPSILQHLYVVANFILVQRDLKRKEIKFYIRR